MKEGSDMSDAGSVVVVGGTRAIGLGVARDYAGPGARRSSSPVADTGRMSRRPWPRSADDATGIAFDLSEPKTIARGTGRSSARSAASSWPPSIATRTRSRDYDIAERSGW